MKNGAAIRFSDFLREEHILCDLHETDCEAAIRTLIARLSESGERMDAESVAEECISREKAASTVIAQGLAIPHARVEGLEEVRVAIGTSTRGVRFFAEDRGLVHLMILILTPKESPGVYLQTLSALTRELNAPGALARLLSLRSPREILSFFTQTPVELPPYLKAVNLMESNFPRILESDTLKHTIDLLCAKRLLDVPVVDEEGDLRGAVSMEDILRLALPEHLLWPQDLSSIIHFQPFAAVLKRDQESKVADFMRDDYVTVGPDVPAIQLAKMFLTQEARQIFVVEGRRILGTVDLNAFMAKLFWA